MEIVCGPYLQNVTKHSMTIMWHTDEPATSCVEYEESDRLGWNAYEGRPKPKFDLKLEDSAPKTIHAMTLEGLREEWVYFYRVASHSSDGTWERSAPASFRTAVKDASPFRFVTYGDSMGTITIHKRNAELARRHRPNLCVGSGDMSVDRIGRLTSEFFDCTHDLLRFTPWFSTMGNHDSPNEGYYQYFAFPEPRSWYSFNYGCAHFVVLNSNLDLRADSEQRSWLEWDLERFREARWKFVFFHHPPYCSNQVETVEMRELCPLLEAYRVDVVYNAHATIYERYHPLKAGVYDSKNGVVYYVTGGGAHDLGRSPSWLWDHANPGSALTRAANHFLLTCVAPDSCRVYAVDSNDHVFDSYTIEKQPVPMASLPPASPQLPYAYHAQPMGQIAGLDEGRVRWLLPRPQFAVDEEVKHSDGHSIRWSSDGEEPVAPALRRVLVEDDRALDRVAGKSYEVSAWVQTENVAGGITLSFEWNGDMGFMERVQSDPLTGTHDWTLITITVPPLPHVVYTCRILLSAVPGTTGTAWFDEVTIQEVLERS